MRLTIALLILGLWACVESLRYQEISALKDRNGGTTFGSGLYMEVGTIPEVSLPATEWTMSLWIYIETLGPQHMAVLEMIRPDMRCIGFALSSDCI
jgi:hypothetical protein